MLKNMGIKGKLVLVIALPVLGLLYFATSQVLEVSATMRE